MSDSSYFSHPRPELLQYLPAEASRILDVGCGEGTFSAGLKAQQTLEAWGIEIDEASAAVAATKLDKVITGDAVLAVREMSDIKFDCVFLNDILEHLVEPDELLHALTDKLTPQGLIVASIPNVRHFPHLRDLVIHGRWEYVDEGILDRTHLRFFTRSSLQNMFQRCGYRVDSIAGIHPTGSLYFRLFNLLTFGRFSEMRYLQFACVVRPIVQS